MLTGEIRVEPGETLRLHYTVENTGETATELTFADGGRADCAVFDGDAELWRWSSGRLFTQAVEHDRIEPGGSREFTFEWEPTGPGEYVARGELRAEAVDCPAEATFSVESLT
jgi:hypothetical protein